MASSSLLLLRNSLLLIILSASIQFLYATAYYTSIISFGDSLADTGNKLHLSKSNKTPLPPAAFPPYGQTFFHQPNGRMSDGRLVIDFIAEYLGFPLVPPYFGGTATRNKTIGWGVNFAVSGATALVDAFFEEKGIRMPNFVANVSLGNQLGWFNEFLPSLCQAPSSCKKLLRTSLVLMGEIGGNDYNYPLWAERSIEEVESFVSPVVDAIASAIIELIELGAVTFIVPGNLPLGCSPSYLTIFKTGNEEEYDPITGCIIYLNKFAEYHNEVLQKKLSQIRELHPYTNIIYADYYNAAMRFYSSPNEYGFSGGALVACCGGGGPYNYNSTVHCGYPPSTGCVDPSLYVSWDGIHLTEAAYKMIAKGILEGPYAIPRFQSSLVSMITGPANLSAI